MPEYKQGKIVEIILSGIKNGKWTTKLPPALDLAEELDVNFKTVNKALNQLVDEGMLMRKKGCGTFIRQTMKREANPDTQSMIEILFEGYTTVSNHPFWGDIWSGVVETLTRSGYFPVLNQLDKDPATGLLQFDEFRFCESKGKVLLGVSENRLVKLLKQNSDTPFVCVADAVEDPEALCAFVDDDAAIHQAVDLLAARGAKKIAFIGVTCCYANMKLASRFNSYLDAIQKYTQINPSLIENTRLLTENGYPAMRAILTRDVPDAVLVSGNHMIPGVLCALKEAGLKVPEQVVICGCDGVMADVPFPYPTVISNRRKCGELGAKLLLEQIAHPDKKPANVRVAAEFRP